MLMNFGVCWKALERCGKGMIWMCRNQSKAARKEDNLTAHVAEKTTTAASIIIVVIVTITSSAVVTHVVVVVVAIHVIATITAHEAVKVAAAAPSATPTAVSETVFHVIVHAVSVFCIATTFVANIVRKLIAAVSPTASVAGATHDSAGSSKIIVIRLTSSANLHISQESRSSHTITGSKFSREAIHIVVVVGISHASAVAHHAIPHAFTGHSTLKVFDLVHAGTKIVPGTSTSAINVAAVFAVDIVLHGAAVSGNIDTSLVAIVGGLGVLSGSVLEVTSGVIKVVTTSVGVVVGTSATAVFGTSGVLAASHNGKSSRLGSSKGRDGLEGIRSSEDCREEEGSLCEFHGCSN